MSAMLIYKHLSNINQYKALSMGITVDSLWGGQHIEFIYVRCY